MVAYVLKKMTLTYYTNEIRQLVKERGDDSDLDDRLIIRWINSQRALWIKNQVNNEYTIEDNIVQMIPCLELRVASAAECPYIESDRRYLVSKREIPKPIEFKDRLGLQDIRIPEIGGYSLNMVKKDTIKYSGNGRYNSRDIFGFYHNNRIYIKVPENNYRIAMLTNITVEAVFDNPLAVAGFLNCNNEPCYEEDYSDYPISDALWEYMLGEIMRTKLGIFESQTSKDENNDSESS